MVVCTVSFVDLITHMCTVNNAIIVVVMVALCYRADHYIFILWFLSFCLFFPRLISAVADPMSAILPHVVWP